MEQQQGNGKPSSRLPGLWPWLGLLLVLLSTAFIRFRLLDMPLERDEGEYAYAGQLLLQGIPPWKLAYNMKLPGTYVAYALGMAAFGQSPAGIHLTLLFANGLTIIFVFLLGRELLGPGPGLAASAVYAVLSVSPAVMGMEAHANHFVVLFAVPGTLLLWKAVKGGRARAWFFSGLLHGIALTMMQQAVCFCLFGWAVLLAQTVVARPLFTRQFLKRSALFGCGMFLPLAGVCLYAAWAGVFSRFWFWTVTYASTYVTGVSWQDGWNNLCAYLQKKFVIYAGFSGLIAIGLLAAFRNGGQRSQPGNPSLFVWAFFLFSCLGASIGLYFREHYFILLLPALSILTGRSLIRLQGALAGWRRVAIVAPSLLFAVVLGWTVFFQRRLFFQLPADVVLRAIYPDEPFPLTPAIGRFIRGHSAPNATVAVIGSEPEVYFYSHRHSATGYIYTYGLMEAQPYALKMQRQMISEIESNRPEYLLWVGYPDSWNVRPASHRGIFAWFGRYAERFYEPVGAANGGTGGLDAGKLVLYKRNHVGSQ